MEARGTKRIGACCCSDRSCLAQPMSGIGPQREGGGDGATTRVMSGVMTGNPPMHVGHYVDA